MKHPLPIPATRRGVTLLEMMVALATSGVLLAGMASSVFISLKATSRSATPAAVTIDGTMVLSELATDLRFAVAITEQSATAITTVVPDRDEDMLLETIRYAWSATPGDPLTRQYNNGNVVSVADDVHEFALSYTPGGSPVRYLDLTLQISNNATCRVRSAFGLPNRP